MVACYLPQAHRHPLRRQDHVRVHHTNEIASRGPATGKKFVDYGSTDEVYCVIDKGNGEVGEGFVTFGFSC